MGILIGMDEAGYGPHLGPLVVAATAWEVEEGVSGVGCRVSDGRREQGSSEFRISDSGLRIAESKNQTAIRGSTDFGELSRAELAEVNPRSEIGVDLYRVLRNIVAKSASERRIAIADSKVLYQPGQGLRQLERGLHAVLIAMRQSLACWSEIVHYCEADPHGHHRSVCWPDGFDSALPVDAAAEELARLAARLTRACESAGVRPLAIRAKLVFPEQFNDLVEHFNSKGAALSHITAGLLREVMESMEIANPQSPTTEFPTPDTRHPTPTFIVCDKHGGRNFYTALLQHHFSEHWIEPVFESHAESRYEWGPPESRVRATFRVNGERFMPTALASMTAKYLRELAMRAFNAFWSAHVPGLRPTAGYYRDSWRFRNEIAAKQRELGIEDHVLWRKR